MKSILFIISVLVFSSCSHVDGGKRNPSSVDIEGTKIATLENRGSSEELIFSRSGEKGEVMNFYLSQHGIMSLVKSVTVQSRAANELKLVGDKGDEYKFRMFKKLRDTSSDSYNWCWRTNDVTTSGGKKFEREGNEFPPSAGFLFLAPATSVLCAVLPGTPFIAGILLSPVDGIVTVGDKIFDADAIASRKFSKFLRGNDMEVSDRVFESIVKQLSDL